MESSPTHASSECVRLPLPARGLALCADVAAVAVHASRDVFLYRDRQLADRPAHFVSDFSIQQVILCSTTAVCIDSNGAAHTFPLKLKSNPDRPLKIVFNPKAQGILCCHKLNEDVAISLTLAGDLVLSLHKLTNNFKTLSTFPVNLQTKDYHRDAILKATNVSSEVNVKDIFGYDVRLQEPVLTVFTIDRLTIYGQVVDLSGEQRSATVRLFTCPSDICDFHLNGINIIIGLKSGTVVNLSLKQINLIAVVRHLNTSLYKFIPLDDRQILYTDGLSMWTTDVTSENMVFKKIPISQPKHFVKNNNRISCITFSNLLYSFPVSTDAIAGEETVGDGFMSVPRDLASSKQIVVQIMKEIEKNEEILKKIKSENTLMLAVALSKNNAILDKHINIATHIADSYEDVVSSRDSVVLTQPLHRYFEPQTHLLFISLHISTQLRQKFSEMCSCLNNNLQIHIHTKTAETDQSTAVPLGDKTLDNLNILIPVASTNLSPTMNITVKIISPMSGAVDPRQIFWTVVYSKNTVLHAEHFIKIHFNMTNNQKETTHDEIILDIARRNHGSLFDFQLAEENKPAKWSCYIKLPNKFEEILGSKETYEKALSAKTSEYLSKKLGSDDFANSRQIVYVSVCDSRVGLQVVREDGDCVLKLSGDAAAVVCQLRQFVSTRLHVAPGARWLALQSHYTRVENLRRRLREMRGAGVQAVLDVAHQFHKHSLGALPL